MGANAHSDERMRDKAWTRVLEGWTNMARTTIEEKALRLLSAFERAGRTVGRVTVEGRRIEIVFSEVCQLDEFERIEMRHDKA